MPKDKLILKTERLILRRIQKTDIPALLELWTDPKATEHLGGPRERNKLQTIFEEDVENPFANEYDLWPVVEKRTDQVIGHCGLLEKEIKGVNEIEINYIFLPSAWGKGYATEIGKGILTYAFEKKKLKKIIALIKPDNQESEKVAKKLGMKYKKEINRPGGAVRKLYLIGE